MLSLILAVAVAASSSGSPWERGPFAASPSEVARAAAELKPPKDAALEFLFRGERVVLEADGSSVNVSHAVYRPLSAEAVRTAGFAFARWQPSFQERPEIRARVISSQGEAYVLDPATLSEAPVEPTPGVVTDQRLIGAPLPGVENGSIIELLITIRAHEPVRAMGSFFVVGVAGAAPRHLHVRVEAPASLPLRHALRDLPDTLGETRDGERRVLEWDWTGLADAARVEPGEPALVSPGPHLALSTGQSWAAVAEGYAAIVDEQLARVDLAVQAREIAQGAKTREDAAARILAFIRDRIRYSGLELGMSAVIPASPIQVLARRYGDCKDVTLLFVGLMRALGHEAHVALLRAGPTEVDPALPALAVFNHAIVRLGGTEPLFVDPLMPELRLGLLPPAVDGKLALIARSGTKDLLRLPTATAADYRLDIERQIRLERVGSARVTEVRRLEGVPAAEARLFARQRTAEQVERAYVESARERLKADDATASVDGPNGAAVVIRVEAKRSKLGTLRDDDAEASLDPRLTACLPGALLPAPPSNGGREPGPGERKRPLVVLQPCVGEVRYRVSAPAGFELVEPLPRAFLVSTGPLRFEAKYAAEPDGAVSARFTVSLPRGEIVASDVNSIRSALAGFDLDGPEVKFRRRSARLLELGQGREALTELHRLAAAAPADHEAVIRLALAYHKLGLGSAARAAARRAVALAPESGWAQRVLASVLSEDLVSRYLKPGCDLAGAIAAQRRAVELDPRASKTLGHLGTLLRYGEDGGLLGRGAQPDEAVKVLRKVRDELGDRAFDVELLRSLAYAGRFGEAAALARELPSDANRNAILLAALVMTEGAEAASREAARVPAGDRAAALTGATGVLMLKREYARGAEFLDRAGALSETVARLQTLSRTLHAASHLDETAPAGTLQGGVRAFVQASLGSAPLVDVLAPERTRPPRDVQHFGASLRAAASDLPAVALPDLTVAAAQIQVEEEAGDAARVSFTYALKPLRVYLLRSGSRWRVLAMQGEDGELERHALRLLERGDVAQARRLLRWAEEDRSKRVSRDDDVLSAMKALAADPAMGPSELRLRAAAFSAISRDPSPAVPILEEALSEARTDTDRRPFQAALALAYQRLERWSDLLKVAEAVQADASSAWAAAFRVQALAALGRTEQVRRAVREETAGASIAMMRAVGQAAVQAGALDEGIALLARSVEKEEPAAPELNNLAWAKLFVDPMPPTAVQEAQRAADLLHNRDATTLHTLAAVLARAREPGAAMKALRDTIEREGGAIHSSDWLVVGLVAEAYGEVEEAMTAYRQVERPDRPSAMSGWAFSQRALARLEAETKQTSAR